MTDRICNISGLMHRVTSSCLTHPRAGGLHGHADGDDEVCASAMKWDGPDKDEMREENDSVEGIGIWKVKGRLSEMEAFMTEVFDAVSALKFAYVGLQDAQSSWDPDRIHVSDAAVVVELRKLAHLHDCFQWGTGRAAGGRLALKDVVAPYEAALEDLRRELKAKEAKIMKLKDKLRGSTPRGAGFRRGRHQSSKRVGCISGIGEEAVPTPELFQWCVQQVKVASQSFTMHLLSLMRAARWDLAAVTRSILEGCHGLADLTEHALPQPNMPESEHERHVLESYVNRKLFHGFENETFYLDGSLASLLRPAEFRRDCFAQFRDMRAMDPNELLGILPTCQFGRFAGKKYLGVVHPKMEDSLFGGSDQRLAVMAGNHPRTSFYGEFLRLAKAVWQLHLLAFAIDPTPSHFEASRGADFHPEYMESVVKFPGVRAASPGSVVVWFSVAPGFKLGNGSVVRARVFLTRRAKGEGTTRMNIMCK
ncbi:hypothetical protein AXF42_Ash019116 [Apostasia shenzhenica]|uniref:Uncharacterized protein n=1 Tax=Apostasia shenzhenica TaxID=1088818 RepID=A0A2I0AAB9_9ASPA|nr:hypothetical protein AXF42_Ash019116 [Apostasia shenzhenica]